jgi:hypothetical protein
MSDDSKLPGIERSSDEIRSDIAARRESITQTVGQLGEKIHQTFDWKEQVARHPYACVGLAAGVGFFLGGLLHRKSPKDRIVDAFVDAAEELGDSLRASARRLLIRTAAPSLFRGTIYGIASKALMQYLQNRAIHAEGNGGNPSQSDQWRDIRSSESTTPNVS